MGNLSSAKATSCYLGQQLKVKWLGGVGRAAQQFGLRVGQAGDLGSIRITLFFPLNAHKRLVVVLAFTWRRNSNRETTSWAEFQWNGVATR